MDDVAAPNLVKARNSERIVYEFYKKLGFQVSLTSKCHGPDVTVETSSGLIRVEVKTATKTQNGCWRVGYVQEPRKNDDVIAIVFPDDRIHFESMKSHLSKCNKHGERSVTDIARGNRWAKRREYAL